MLIPEFEYPELAEEMMNKGINPKVISYSGNSKLDLNPTSFKSDSSKTKANSFPNSIHFTTEDSKCDNDCKPGCTSNLKRFYFVNGPLVVMEEKNKIGQGGFGSVYNGTWHGKDAAMKCLLIGQIEFHNHVGDAISDFEKNISEYRIQLSTPGSGILIPNAMVRQQNQKNENGKWIALNYNVFIYPKYDCNLYELHENHYDQFNDVILTDILNQCLIRNEFIITP